MVFMKFEIQDNKTLHERYDYRIKYLNLKKTRSQNSLALEDVQRLWIPFLVFDNTERNEATKVSQCNCHLHHGLHLFCLNLSIRNTGNLIFSVHSILICSIKLSQAEICPF